MSTQSTVLSTILRRRAELRRRLDPSRNLEALEESCVPSYCHPNPLAAGVAWWRLAKVAALCRRRAAFAPLLDFGAATGEVAHLLGGIREYHFVEADEALAKSLLEWHPQARRERLESLPEKTFRTILALDSLEHNEDVGAIVGRLAVSLRDDGVLIVSGPTESALYRLGRRIAGFGGHYHKQTVYDVEAATAAVLEPVGVVRVPPLIPLFRISLWRHRVAGR
jgi:hypothetical protein